MINKNPPKTKVDCSTGSCKYEISLTKGPEQVRTTIIKIIFCIVFCIFAVFVIDFIGTP